MTVEFTERLILWRLHDIEAQQGAIMNEMAQHFQDNEAKEIAVELRCLRLPLLQEPVKTICYRCMEYKTQAVEW